MKRLSLALAILTIGPAASLWSAEKDAKKLPPAAAGVVDFEKDIAPILVRDCLSCHNEAKHRAGVRLDRADEARKGGNAGPFIVPGDSRSRLLTVIAGLDEEVVMPPRPRKLLTAEEVGKFRAWIEQGARWPDQVVLKTQVKEQTHWAFQPIRRPALPDVSNAAWIRNDIDRFILARLEKEGIAPSPEADRYTLIRRLSLDLIGLPPTPAEVEAFIQDTSPNAYEKLVDHLLASPHYGERWGRHWLDLARYADSDGYEKDTGRPFAWRFRSWVIDALNRDLPFDQFTIEQLAGDLLPGATLEQKIATGFHRNTLTNREGGVDKEQFRVEAVVDRVNTTCRVWLGVTMACAQCHDHKYDPFMQREYYQLFAFFNSDIEEDLLAPLPGEEAVYAQKKAAHDRNRAELVAKQQAYRDEALPKWEESLKVAALRELPGNVRDILLVEPSQRDGRQRQDLAAHHASLNLPETLAAWEKQLGVGAVRALPAPVRNNLLVEPSQRTDKQKQEIAAHFSRVDAQAIELARAISAHDRSAPQLGKAQTMKLGSTRPTHVMIRGDFLRPGVEVQHGTPAVLPPMQASSSPNRLDLARWLVDGRNPLTARVISNWIWHKYFGRGIVETLEDFGTRGESPSHPELLEYLATQLMGEPGAWSLKRFHKLIVTSATYRQSSAYRPELRERDALNVLLARQNRLRLEAEIIRDSTLAASGLLSRKIGGPSVRPPQPAGISELTYAGSARWVESQGEDRYRRGLYTWFQRTSPYPMLMTFDAPDGVVCANRRERSNTPLQALTLLNDVVFVETAQALGRRIVAEVPSGVPRERIRHAVRLCLAREPAPEELTRLVSLYEALRKHCHARPEESAKLVGGKMTAGADVAETAAWVALGRTLLNLDEFVTRE